MQQAGCRDGCGARWYLTIYCAKCRAGDAMHIRTVALGASSLSPCRWCCCIRSSLSPKQAVGGWLSHCAGGFFALGSAHAYFARRRLTANLILAILLLPSSMLHSMLAKALILPIQ